MSTPYRLPHGLAQMYARRPARPHPDLFSTKDRGTWKACGWGFRVMVLSAHDDQPIFSLTIFDVAVGAALVRDPSIIPYPIAAALNRTVINSGPALIRLHHTTRYVTYPDKWY
ncbi:uncharacterized protein ARMOST_21044 [Armillaria ostoyae]|uniref:Uncharacterized protein n=1 Tax=Armillaria ostoyae TaxID=47428 RepID=A0A284S903_ARMOS|nr:uncharacterized protein ARMOST_21044 [Armillaria ostoyae]